MIQFHYGNSPYESLGVQWDTSESTDLDSTLDQFAASLLNMGVVFKSQGERSPMSVGDHEILYQAFEVEEGEYKYPGYSGAWSCDASNRLIIFYFATTPLLAQENDMFWQFLSFIESFEC
jgi:hypothetical protein